MIVFGWAATIVGAVLFLAALGMTLHANSSVRVPFYRNAEVVPSASITMRSVGAGLLVFGAAALSLATSYWTLVVAVAVLAIVLIAIIIHNRKVESRSVRRNSMIDGENAHAS